MNKWVLKSLEAKITKLKLPCVGHTEKAGYFGKDNNAGKNRKQQEKSKAKHEMVDCIKEEKARDYRS